MARKLNKRQPKPQAGLGIKSGITALYVRVSTDRQADEGNSLEAQRDKLMAHCALNGWQVDEQSIYVDAGVSGKTTEKRDAFNAMLDAARAGQIERIVVTKRDRFARNTVDFLTKTDELTRLGVALVCLDINLDTSTPVGKFISTIFAGFAEWEASLITDRVMTGKAQNAKNGGYNGSRAPMGYTYRDGEFVLNEQAGTVYTIFQMFLDNCSLTYIAERLNATDVPTAKGGRWYPATVRYVLTNGFYAGLAQWHGVESQGTHEAIVSRETYEAAHTKLASMKPGPRSTVTHRV